MTFMVAVIVALWIIGAGAIFLLLSFGMGDDSPVDRAFIAAVWPFAAIFLMCLFLFEMLREARKS